MKLKSPVTNNGMWEEIFDKLAARTPNHPLHAGLRQHPKACRKNSLRSRRTSRLRKRRRAVTTARSLSTPSRRRAASQERRDQNPHRHRIFLEHRHRHRRHRPRLPDQHHPCRGDSDAARRARRTLARSHPQGPPLRGQPATTSSSRLPLSARCAPANSTSLKFGPANRRPAVQQIVACCGAEPWEEDTLFNTLRRAYPYRNLTRAQFDDLIALLSEGIESSRGRYGAYLLRDGVHHQLLHPQSRSSLHELRFPTAVRSPKQISTASSCNRRVCRSPHSTSTSPSTPARAM